MKIFLFCIASLFGRYYFLKASVLRIRIFSIPDPGSKRFPDPDLHQRIQLFLTQKIVSKLLEIWSGMFIPGPDPESWFFFTHSGSRIQGSKGLWNPDPQHWIKERVSLWWMQWLRKGLVVYFCTIYTCYLIVDGRCVRLGIESTIRVKIYSINHM